MIIIIHAEKVWQKTENELSNQNILLKVFLL